MTRRLALQRWISWLLPLAVAWPGAAPAQVDLTRLAPGVVGPRSQVLVLGTIHLRAMPATFKPAALDGVLRRLETFKPDIITVELQSGEECDLARRHTQKYGNGFNCPSTEVAQAATGLDIPAAIAEVDKTLKAWPAQPSPAQRRHLAALLLASADTVSAYVQWLRLPEAERHAGDGLDAALVQALERLATRTDETYLIAAHLAARLGLERTHATDNHTGDALEITDEAAFDRAMKAAWSGHGADVRKDRERQQALTEADDLLPLYRFINEPGYLRRLAEANVGPAMRSESPDRYPQRWVGGWETRNLRMVANIRETFRERPGARVLTLVGASHKPWFDSWLSQLQGVDVLDAEALLK